MALNEQLNNIYQPYFNELITHLKNDKLIDKVQPPFLLGLNREKDGNVSVGDETWYTQANLKVMVFGKEVHEWGWPKLEDGAQLISDDLVEAYEMFYSENYRDTFFLTDSNSKLSKSPFFRTGFNGLMDGINERLKKVYSEKKVAFLWNEISKLSTREGRSRKVHDSIHRYETDFFHVIPQEIELLKPDIIIFLTGFGEPYDQYIHENFHIQSTSSVDNISINDVIKMELKEVSLAYKTHHPGTTNVAGHSLKDAERWNHYNAILDDIAANFNKIQGLQ